LFLVSFILFFTTCSWYYLVVDEVDSHQKSGKFENLPGVGRGDITFAILGIFLIVASMLTLWVYNPSTPRKNKETMENNSYIMIMLF